MPFLLGNINTFQGYVSRVPWQTKSTRILIKTPFKMRCPAAICSDLRGVNSSLCIGHFCTENAKLSKILQDVYIKKKKSKINKRLKDVHKKRSKKGVKSGWGYYSFIPVSFYTL